MSKILSSLSIGAVAPFLLSNAPQPLELPYSPATDRTWLASPKEGTVFRIAYFTEEEIKDAGWEQLRLAQMGIAESCDSPGQPETEVYRAQYVQWHPTSDGSGKQCAAVIYVVSCGEAVSSTLSQYVSELISTPPDRELKEDCGDKFAIDKKHYPDKLPPSMRPKG